MKPSSQHKHLLFGRLNYIILGIGLLTIAFGFILMSGGGSDDPNVFNEAVFSFRRIRLAPTLIFIGFGICIYSIFKNPDKKSDKETTSQELHKKS